MTGGTEYPALSLWLVTQCKVTGYIAKVCRFFALFIWELKLEGEQGTVEQTLESQDMLIVMQVT